MDSERYVMEETPVRDDMVGLPATDVRPDHPAIVLGIVRDGDVTVVLDDDPVVRPDDVLITLATRRRPR
ncbi:MAG: hypothetical protein ACM3OO_03030 [Planctomycetaceae bacterium]